MAEIALKVRPLVRREALCALIDVSSQKGLEFGPLSTPIVRPTEGDIRYVDHASTEDLRVKYVINEGHDINEFMPISYVWAGQPLREIIPAAEVFDYALASHVIEHVPDVIGWVNDIMSVLTPAGILSLAIPDKRYTFDHLRRTTTAATLIDHHLRKAKTPTAEQMFDHFSQVIKVGNDEIALLFDGEPIKHERHTSDELVLHITLDALQNAKYVDCHASVFTPRSFLEVFKMLIDLRLVNANVVDFYDTAFRSQEFVCVLQRSERPDTSLIDQLLPQLPA